VTEAVQAAAIRRRIRIPLRFADGYSTTATVVSFAGLADAQHFGLVRGCVTSGTPMFLALSCNPAAHDRVLRTDVRRRVRAPLPAAPWWIPLRQAISARGSRLRRWWRDA
jgi:hypothetical protein